MCPGGRAGTPKDMLSAVSMLLIPECKESGEPRAFLGRDTWVLSGTALAVSWIARH